MSKRRNQVEQEEMFMRNNKMNYGSIVDLAPVVYADTCVFIPKYFSWEKESHPAEIVMGDYSIRCNLGTKLFFKTDKGIKEMKLLFTKKDESYKLNILEFFENNNITYTLGDGIYCDGGRYNQKNSTGEVIYDKNIIIEKTRSPYWGLQMELFIVNKKLRPRIRGKEVKIIRFNYCRMEKQYRIEAWFRSIVNGSVQITPYSLDQVMRENLESIDFTSCGMFCKNHNEYDWENYC